MTILALPNQPAALLAVTSGRAVGDLTDHSTALYNAKTINNGNTFEVVVDPASPQGYQPQLVGIGIVASNTALISTVQKALQDLINDGSLSEDRRQRTGLLPVTSAQVNQGAKPIPSDEHVALDRECRHGDRHRGLEKRVGGGRSAGPRRLRPEAIKAIPVRHWGRWVSAVVVIYLVDRAHLLVRQEPQRRLDHGRQLPLQAARPARASCSPSS